MNGKSIFLNRWVIVLVIMIVCALAAGYLGYRNKRVSEDHSPVSSPKVSDEQEPVNTSNSVDPLPAVKDEQEPVNTSNSVDPLPAVKTVFNNFKNQFKGEVYESNELSVWWISDDDLNIINEPAAGITLAVFGCNSDIRKQQPSFKEMALSIGRAVDDSMQALGFRRNERNSSASIDDTQFYDYIQAYENGSSKATFTANPDCSSDSSILTMHYAFTFALTADFEKNYAEQSSYLKDLGLDDSIIRISKRVGDFVGLNVYSRRAGYYLIAKKIDGKWTKLFGGNEGILCDVVAAHNIPKEVYGECVANYP